MRLGYLFAYLIIAALVWNRRVDAVIDDLESRYERRDIYGGLVLTTAFRAFRLWVPAAVLIHYSLE